MTIDSVYASQVVIDGLVDHPVELSMDELITMVEPETVTSYMACTGTRWEGVGSCQDKPQSMVSQFA